MKALRWTGIGLAVLLVLVAGFALWAVGTAAGARFALARVQGVLGEKLVVGRLQGTLAGPLELHGLAYRDSAAGVDLTVQRVRVDLALLALLRARVHVVDAGLEGVRLELSEPTRPPPPEEDQPFSLEPPVDVLVDRLVLREARVTRRAAAVDAGGSEPAELVDVRTAGLQGSWTRADGIVVRQLDVVASQGEVHFSAQVGQGDGDGDGGQYVGKGSGRFRWRAGEHTFAGTLAAEAGGGLASASVALTAPLAAQLQAGVRQETGLPWTFALEVPAFDPRESLLPDSPLSALAVSLAGQGTAQRGTTSGRVALNGQTIDIESLGFAREGEELALDARLRMAGGALQAKGDVHLAREPVAATLDLQWQDLVLPADLVGQVLHTRGQLAFDGSAVAYRATGKVTVGPPGRLADIDLDVQGTPERVRIARLDVVQAAGRLAARGEVDLKPLVAWRMTADARRFDPGAFAARWRGDLSFHLQTNGALREAGPEATLVVRDLTGTLRDRRVAGEGNLELSSARVLTGKLEVSSGRSRIAVDGRRGRELDARAQLDVESLTDWLPDASGSLRAKVAATGRWPDVRIAGTANGSALRMAENGAESLALTFDVRSPLDPSGTVKLEAAGVAAAGFDFATVALQAEGGSARHMLQLDADGEPLSLELRLQGAADRARGAWSGELQHVVVAGQNVARLELQEPVRIRVDGPAMSLSQACFAENDIRLCFEGDRKANGALQASYSLQQVPLGMANAFMPPAFALVLEGIVDGDGRIARSASGRLDGTAHVRSASGRIARAPAIEGDEPPVLLRYADLSLDANLAGADAQLKLAARLDDTGSLEGEVAASGLGEAVSPLRGSVTASLPSLAVIQAFAPQLDAVKGRAAVRATVAGTMDSPDISGSLELEELSADVLLLGLKLREGRASVTPGADGTFDLAGSIRSGSGELSFDGNATTKGLVTVDIRGKDFLAADLPGVRVTMTPELRLERTAERTMLSGKLLLPSADVNLQRLPRGNRAAAASSDVVILDDEVDLAERAQGSPLHANVAIELGDAVKLTGFGLEATVAGQLDVRERPGEPTTGSGEIRVQGTYKAYGQDLTIRQGQLLYAATPLDNPRLSIVAVRVVDAVTAGLRVSGTAQNPQLAVFSEPAMGQSEALSYLVTGKPLDEIGTGDASDGDMLTSAARSLGEAAGGLLAKRIGQRLGVDEVGIKDSAELGGSVLTVGEYLSPRLYLSYGVGIFEPGQVVTVRYELSDELSLEFENAPESSRTGVQYRIER